VKVKYTVIDFNVIVLRRTFVLLHLNVKVGLSDISLTEQHL